jgi:hypothetical protein
VSEIRDGPEEPDHEDRPQAAAHGDAEAVRARVEPRSRAEYAADLERQDALIRLEPRRAGLPALSIADGPAYLEKNHRERPWLSVARDCSPEAQRVFAALDQGGGHAHIRHEGWVTEEMNERRVRNLEDPAQLDPAKRAAGIDGLTAGDVPHRCGDIASRIIKPKIFAMAFARGVEHPDVRAALDSNGSRPEPVILPISDVLGDDGHKFCSGWQLEPVNGSMEEARAVRRAWAAGNQSGPEPQARSVETFEGGTVTFAFRRSAVGGYEVSTMLMNPADEQPT